jgi:hypothetical protein
MTSRTHEVVSAYESAMARGDRNGTEQARESGTKGRFVKWEIVEPSGDDAHMLTTLSVVTVKFILKINEPVRRGHHGCALFNQDRQLIWAWATDGVKLSVGEHELRYTFPMLPLRPGPYCWQVSIYEDDEEVDAWDCLPEMIVATEVHQHSADHWNGILNMPSRFEVDGRG